MKSVKDLKNLRGKKILLRVDFDLSTSDSGTVISEPFRVLRQKSMIDYLINEGAKVTMVAHISKGDFKNLISQIESLLDHKINLATDKEKIREDELNLIDNIRNWSGEEENNNDFAAQLAEGFDAYINNAFAVCHRNHASVSAITNFIDSYAGFLLEEETDQLGKVINAPKEGKVIIMGGAKAATKIPVIRNLIDRAEKILLGGVIVNDILKERGQDIGNSVSDDNSRELLEGLDLRDSRLELPEDFNVYEGRFLDIGPKSIKKYEEIIGKAGMIIWNGPVGIFENPQFAEGTNSLAKAIASSGAYKVMGGGDSIAAANKLGLLDRFDFVSTGGGAMLAFLAGENLPGLEKLGYYK